MVKYFAVKNEDGKLAFARVSGNHEPRIGLTILHDDPQSKEFALPSGDWTIIAELPDVMSGFLAAVDLLDRLVDQGHGNSQFYELAEQFANYCRSL